MANTAIGQYKRPWRARITFQSGEASATLTAGNAVVLLASDVSKIVSPATAGAAQTATLFAGILTATITPGQFADVIVGGYAPSVTITRMTRAATTDGWASFPAIAIGDYFTFDTVNNYAQRSGAGAALAGRYQLVALETLASATTVASTTSNSATVSTSALKMLVHAMV